jgi:hypothetical protein
MKFGYIVTSERAEDQKDYWNSRGCGSDSRLPQMDVATVYCERRPQRLRKFISVPILLVSTPVSSITNILAK